MSEIMLMSIIKKTILTGALISAPVLLISLVIGLLISILQATTQVQEQTLPFVFKLLGIGIVFMIGGNWIMHRLVVLATELFTMIATMFFAFVRISTFLASCNSIFPQGTPNTFKVLVCFMLSALVSTNLNLNVVTNDMYTVIVYTITELLNGLFLGYVTYLVIHSIKIAGSLIDNQIGLSMASIYDPQSGEQATLIQNLFYWFTIIIFFVTNGHHLVLNGVIESFQSIPIGTAPIVDNFQYLMKLFSQQFAIGFQIGFPIILTLILSDFILGLISRSVPQLNVMIIGMPLKLLFGLVIILISLGFMGNEIKTMLFTIPKILNGYL